MVVGVVRVKVWHHCPLPTPKDTRVAARWECPTCYTVWRWVDRSWLTLERRTGPWWARRLEVVQAAPSSWEPEQQRPARWILEGEEPPPGWGTSPVLCRTP
jgi:hypothetical protein